MNDPATGCGGTAAEPTLEDVYREFPGWEVWQGIGGLVYARKLLTSPPVVLRGEDPTDLRDQIRGWLGKTAVSETGSHP